MHTVRELSNYFGMDERPVYNRIKALERAGCVKPRNGPNNRLELDQDAFAVVERLVWLERDRGVNVSSAVQTVVDEMFESGYGTNETHESKPCQTCAERQILIDHLRRENERLWRLVESPPALPGNGGFLARLRWAFTAGH